jgi:hypothetical protein
MLHRHEATSHRARGAPRLPSCCLHCLTACTAWEGARPSAYRTCRHLSLPAPWNASAICPCPSPTLVHFQSISAAPASVIRIRVGHHIPHSYCQSQSLSQHHHPTPRPKFPPVQGTPPSARNRDRAVVDLAPLACRPKCLIRIDSTGDLPWKFPPKAPKAPGGPGEPAAKTPCQRPRIRATDS